MDRRKSKRIFRNIKRALKRKDIPYKTVGEGHFFFVTFQPDWSFAAIVRCTSLKHLMDVYFTSLDTLPLHHSINESFLYAANLLGDAEPTDTYAERFTPYHPDRHPSVST